MTAAGVELTDCVDAAFTSTERCSDRDSDLLSDPGPLCSTVGLTPAARCMSMLPRKCAPSAIAMRGADRSPSTDPWSRMSARSLAVMFPWTSPWTTMDFAKISALIRPFGPIVSTFCLSSMRQRCRRASR